MTAVNSTPQAASGSSPVEPFLEGADSQLEVENKTNKTLPDPKNSQVDTVSSAKDEKSSWTGWISWPSSFPSLWSTTGKNAPDQSRVPLNLDYNEYEAYKKISLELADLEYQVMRLEARAEAYKNASSWHLENRSLFQELGLMRPDIVKVLFLLDSARPRLNLLYEQLQSEKKSLKAYFAYESKRYEYQAVKKGVDQVVEKGDLSSAEILAFLTKSQKKQQALKKELDLLQKDLDELRLPVKG